jgi:1-phosphatidylinositol-3-phosphate 5-kinase
MPNSNSAASKTLFDGEWIEGQCFLTFLRVLFHSSRVDDIFTSLPQANNALSHYSTPTLFSYITHGGSFFRLLLGIDEERRQIHCGLVDTIGSYTFAKTLEYKAKGFLGKEGKNITVIPPHEYQERFVSALDSYFMACPGA